MMGKKEEFKWDAFRIAYANLSNREAMWVEAMIYRAIDAELKSKPSMLIEKDDLRFLDFFKQLVSVVLCDKFTIYDINSNFFIFDHFN